MWVIKFELNPHEDDYYLLSCGVLGIPQKLEGLQIRCFDSVAAAVETLAEMIRVGMDLEKFGDVTICDFGT